MSGASALAPFRIRRFRFQWTADLCTAWALEMETLILGWYVLVETGSVGWLTVFGSLQFVGTLVSPLLGVLGDRLGLRNVLAGMRLGYTCCAATILALSVSGHLTPAWVLGVAAVCGLIRPSDIGMRSALASANVPPTHLVAAMGISRTTMDSAKIAGALAGTGLMAVFGMTAACTAIALVHLSGMLLTLKVPSTPGSPGSRLLSASNMGARPSPWRDLREGLNYIWRTPRLLAAMSVAALVNLTAYPLTGGLMPYVARTVFELDQRGLGWLVAAFAVGALTGSVSVSALGACIRPGRTMMAACLVWYACLTGFVLSSHLAMAMLLLVGAGIAQSFSMLSLSVLLLRTSDDRFRGRIMGVRMLAIYTLPIGLLVAGALIPSSGFRFTGLMMIAAGVAMAASLTWFWRAELVQRDALGNRTQAG